MRKRFGVYLGAALAAAALLLAGCGNQSASSAPGGGGDGSGDGTPAPSKPVVMVINPAANQVFSVGEQVTVQVNITTEEALAKAEYNFADRGWVQFYPGVGGSSVAAQGLTYTLSFVVDTADLVPGSYSLQVRATDEGGQVSTVSTVIRLAASGGGSPAEPPAGIAEGIFTFTPPLQLDDLGYVVLSRDNVDGYRVLAQDIEGETYAAVFVRGRVQVIVDTRRAGVANATRVQLKLRATNDGAPVSYIIGDEPVGADGKAVFTIDTTASGGSAPNWNQLEGQQVFIVAEIYAGSVSDVRDTWFIIDNASPTTPKARTVGPKADGKSNFVPNLCGTQGDWFKGTAIFDLENAEAVVDRPSDEGIFNAGMEGLKYVIINYDDAAEALSRPSQERAFYLLENAVKVYDKESMAADMQVEVNTEELTGDLEYGRYALFVVTYDRLGNAAGSGTFVDFYADNKPPAISGLGVYDTSPLPFQAKDGFVSDWMDFEGQASDGGIGFAGTVPLGSLTVKIVPEGGTDAAFTDTIGGSCTEAGTGAPSLEYQYSSVHNGELTTGGAAVNDDIRDVSRDVIVRLNRDFLPAYIAYDSNQLSDGRYQLVVEAVDALGNKATLVGPTFIVDNTDPTGWLTLDPGKSVYAAGERVEVSVNAEDSLSGIKYVLAAMNDFVPGADQTRANGYFGAPIEIFGDVAEGEPTGPGQLQRGFVWHAVDPNKAVGEGGQLRLLVIAVDQAGNATLHMTAPFAVTDADATVVRVGSDYTTTSGPLFDVADRDEALDPVVAGGVMFNTGAYTATFPTPNGEGNGDTRWTWETQILRLGLQLSEVQPARSVAGLLLPKILWNMMVEWQLGGNMPDEGDTDFDPSLVYDPTLYDRRWGEGTFDNNQYNYAEYWQYVDEDALGGYVPYDGTETNTGTYGVSPFIYGFGTEAPTSGTRFLVDLAPVNLLTGFAFANWEGDPLYMGPYADAAGFYVETLDEAGRPAAYNVFYESQYRPR